ncbi:MAG: signal peptide peptidase SppA [Vampirovibrionales bacterium]|nr:signal peptide peptidase SppA [Vampirovibrionales bacterium]
MNNRKHRAAWGRQLNQILALSILAFCALSLGVGVFNTFKTPAKNVPTAPAELTDDAPLSALKSKVLQRSHLVMVPIRGMITSGEGDSGVFGSSDSMAIEARNALQSALETDSVKGVLLWIDSPGGTVGISQELYHTILKVSKKKPVVAYLGDIAASGGYYAASAADEIYATPGTLTGSIGVIISSMNLSGLLNNKLGIKPVVIKSGKFKDILSATRDATPAEIALLQDIIDTSYQQFLGAVLHGRTRLMKDADKIAARKASITEVADGRIVIGEKAKALGLVDEIGYYEDAKARLNKLAIERFNLRNNAVLPLEGESESFPWSDLFSMAAQPGEFKARFNQLPFALKQLMMPEANLNHGMQAPLSAQYPNQPLWVWE